jgi:hypothetical protein
MAKKHRSQNVAVAFNYLVKSVPNDADPDSPIESGFTHNEFARVLQRLSDTTPLNEADENVVRKIKMGEDMNFLRFSEIEPGLYFGDFEGAYYGQRIRNNIYGDIDPESLNSRRFHYLITRLRDGKILVGVTYHGQYGDFDGLRSSLSHLLRGNFRVASKVLRSVSTEIGEGQPVAIKLTYRRRADQPEGRPLFGASGEIAIKKSDFGDEFGDRVINAVNRVRGTEAERKRVLAEIVTQGEMLELDEDEIVGCSALVRQKGKYRTVYFLGENPQSTRFPLQVDVGAHGDVNPDEVATEMTRVMRHFIMPMLHDAQSE